MKQKHEDKLREHLRQTNWSELPFDAEEFKDLPTHCYECKEPIDIFEGYYVVAEREHACSEKCTRKMLGEEVFNEGKTEWEDKGDSNIYYWTDWS